MHRRALGILLNLFLGATVVGAAPAVAAAQAVASNPWAAVTAAMMPQAIAAIERGSGGRVLEIRFRMRRGAPGFSAVVANPDDTIGRVTISVPDMQVVVLTATDIPDWMAPWSLRADRKSIMKAKVRLSDAVVQAEQIRHGVAVDAGLAQPLSGGNDVLAYNIEVVDNGRPRRVVIDAQTGERIADPQPLLQGWTPEEALMQSLKMTP